MEILKYQLAGLLPTTGEEEKDRQLAYMLKLYEKDRPLESNWSNTPEGWFLSGAVLGKPFELGFKGLGMLGKASWNGLSKVFSRSPRAATILSLESVPVPQITNISKQVTKPEHISAGFEDVIKYYKSPRYKLKLLQSGYTEKEADETISLLIQNLGEKTNGNVEGLNLISIRNIDNNPGKYTNGRYLQSFGKGKIGSREVVLLPKVTYPRGTARHEFFHASSLAVPADADIIPPNWVSTAILQQMIKRELPELIKLIEKDSKILKSLKVSDEVVPVQEVRSLALESDIESQLIANKLHIPKSDVFKLNDDVLTELGVSNLRKIKHIFGENSEKAVQKFITGTGVAVGAGSLIANQKRGGKMNILDYLKEGSKIYIKKKNRGKFTASAKAAGEGVQEHAHKVMNDPNATPLQRKRANFAIQAKRWHKHKDGGVLNYLEYVN